MALSYLIGLELPVSLLTNLLGIGAETEVGVSICLVGKEWKVTQIK